MKYFRVIGFCYKCCLFKFLVFSNIGSILVFSFHFPRLRYNPILDILTPPSPRSAQQYLVMLYTDSLVYFSEV